MYESISYLPSRKSPFAMKKSGASRSEPRGSTLRGGPELAAPVDGEVLDVAFQEIGLRGRPEKLGGGRTQERATTEDAEDTEDYSAFHDAVAGSVRL